MRTEVLFILRCQGTGASKGILVYLARRNSWTKTSMMQSPCCRSTSNVKRYYVRISDKKLQTVREGFFFSWTKIELILHTGGGNFRSLCLEYKRRARPFRLSHITLGARVPRVNNIVRLL